MTCSLALESGKESGRHGIHVPDSRLISLMIDHRLRCKMFTRIDDLTVEEEAENDVTQDCDIRGEENAGRGSVLSIE